MKKRSPVEIVYRRRHYTYSTERRFHLFPCLCGRRRTPCPVITTPEEIDGYRQLISMDRSSFPSWNSLPLPRRQSPFCPCPYASAISLSLSKLMVASSRSTCVSSEQTAAGLRLDRYPIRCVSSRRKQNLCRSTPAGRPLLTVHGDKTHSPSHIARCMNLMRFM